jgi:hypothetical protein
MHQPTAEKITKLTSQILKYWQLHPEEQKWIYPLLSKPVQNAINILEACSDKPRGYKEISKICEIHPNTVKQYLYALSNGGLQFSVNSNDHWLAPKSGRPRRLVLK